MTAARTGAADVSAYLAGLRLVGRRVVVVGAGAVAERRLGLLLAAGADVTVVAPGARPAIVRAARRGELGWIARPYESGDLGPAWYVLAATDSAVVNALVARDAEAERIFCVRADDAREATAWTPATAEIDGVTIGVLARRDPRRSVQVRDSLVHLLRQLTRRAA